jgi:hypothetical protein
VPHDVAHGEVAEHGTHCVAAQALPKGTVGVMVVTLPDAASLTHPRHRRPRRRREATPPWTLLPLDRLEPGHHLVTKRAAMSPSCAIVGHVPARRQPCFGTAPQPCREPDHQADAHDIMDATSTQPRLYPYHAGARTAYTNPFLDQASCRR